MSNERYRPCIINGSKEGLFHCWFCRQEIAPPSPLKGGTCGKQLSEIFGLVEFRNGNVREFYPSEIKFLDSEDMFSKYSFKLENENESN